MGFSISLPVVGQPHSTEDPKVGNALSTISTWGNGQIADTDIASPNNSFRRLLLQGGGLLTSANAPGTWLVSSSGFNAASGVAVNNPIQIWGGDAGYNSQPQDFQVAGKTATARMRATLVCNAVAPGISFTFGLFPLTSVVGSGSITFTVGASLGSATFTTPIASTFLGSETTAFTLPTSALGYVMGVTTVGTMTVNSIANFSLQLYAYSA